LLIDTRLAWDVYVPTWTWMVYVAFVMNAFARRVIGWRVATPMTTTLVLDGLEHAVFTRENEDIRLFAPSCRRPRRMAGRRPPLPLRGMHDADVQDPRY
jgi:hypothetical protein